MSFVRAAVERPVATVLMTIAIVLAECSARWIVSGS